MTASHASATVSVSVCMAREQGRPSCEVNLACERGRREGAQVIVVADRDFHTPTTEELAFLRIVTRGYPELQAQIESCEVADYDPDGYCDVRVLSGPPSPEIDHCDGPSLLTCEPNLRSTETILWIDRGMLASVEIVEYPISSDGVYARYIEGDRDSKLTYRDPQRNL